MIDAAIYNTIEKDITNGLDNVEVNFSGAGDYLILQYCPIGADVKIRVNNTFNHAIPLDINSGIECKGLRKFYVTCNAIDGEKIRFIQSKSSDEFRYIPPVVNKLEVIEEIGKVNLVQNINNLETVEHVQNVQNVQTVGSFSTTLLKQLNDLLRPLEQTSYTNGVVETTTSNVNQIKIAFDKVMDCDEVEVFLSAHSETSALVYTDYIQFWVEVDGVDIGCLASDPDALHDNIHRVIKDAKGKHIVIKHFGLVASNKCCWTVAEYNKKSLETPNENVIYSYDDKIMIGYVGELYDMFLFSETYPTFADKYALSNIEIRWDGKDGLPYEWDNFEQSQFLTDIVLDETNGYRTRLYINNVSYLNISIIIQGAEQAGVNGYAFFLIIQPAHFVVPMGIKSDFVVSNID